MCAEDTDGARTAIRLIPQLAQGKEAVAAALRMPIHPVLPRAIGSGALNGTAWVALDFPEGELLTNQIPLKTSALLTMGAMIAGALAALHEKDIIHGELSSESVLVVPATAGDRFVLFDAPLVVMNRLTDRRGEERLLSQLTVLVPFLSPERARGAKASRSSDVWALGMIISIASGAKGVPGTSTLEKIAGIVTNKWRPAVSGTLPIALRLLLTRMLAPEPSDRPSAMDSAIELEHLCVALTAVDPVAAFEAPVVERLPFVEKTVIVDPFEALVAEGVTAVEVTDPQTAQVPGPTAPSGPLSDEPTMASLMRGLLIPALPAKPRRRTPLPLPPILDPAALTVPSQPARHPSPAPRPGVVASVPEFELPNFTSIQTMRFGALPGAVRPPKPLAVLTEDVADEAAAARASIEAAAPTPLVDAPSIHDQAEDAFAANVRLGQQHRFLAAGIIAGLLFLAIAGLVVKSQYDSPSEPSNAAEPVKAEPVKAEPVKAEPVEVEPLKAERTRAKPVAAAAPVKAAKPGHKTAGEEGPRRPASRLDEGD